MIHVEALQLFFLRAILAAQFMTLSWKILQAVHEMLLGRLDD